MKRTADVVIVGAGIIGCATAYFLAKGGNSNIIVIDSTPYIGSGGSCRNCGGVRQSGRDKRELPVVMYGIQNIWPTLSEELGVDCEYHQDGNLRLGKTPAHIKTLEGLADKARSCGLDVRMVSGDEAREICPYLSTEVIGASWCPTDGHANPLTTTLGYYIRARQMGVRFYTNQKAAKIRKIKGRARQVVTEDGEIYEGETIMVAAGYASRALLSTIGVDVPMITKKAECIVTEAQPPMFWQMLGTAASDFYGHQTKHGSFVFGGFSGMELYDKDDGTPVNSSFSLSCTSRAILQYFPSLVDAKVVRNWAGWYDQCVDGVPVISTVEEVPGLIVACAFCGHGFGISPAVGTLLSQMITGQELAVDLSEFRYDRFKAKI